MPNFIGGKVLDDFGRGLFASAFIFGLLSACSPSSGRYAESCPAGSNPPTIRPVGSTVLSEGDSVRLGNPGATFVATTSGVMFFPDHSSGVLAAFGRDGSYLGAVGKKGGGPGEFVGIGTFGLATDSLLFFDDNAGRRLNIYSLNDRQAIGSISYEGYLAWITASRGDLILGLTAMGSRRTVTIGRQDSLLRELGKGLPGPLMSRFVKTPPEYAIYPLLSEWNDTKVIGSADSLVVAFGGLSYLARQSFDADSQDVIEIPRCHRRGSPVDSLNAWFRHRPTTAQEQLTIDAHTSRSISALLGMWRLSDGTVAVWYQDPWFEDKVLKAVAFVTILDRNLARACVDVRIEAPGLERPRIAMQGDTLLVLDQRETGGAEPRVESVVGRFIIDTTQCTWLATRITRRRAS